MNSRNRSAILILARVEYKPPELREITARLHALERRLGASP